MTRLVIAPPVWGGDEVSTSLTLGQTLGEREHSVRLVASEEIGKEADFLVPLTLLPAMVTGSRLVLPEKISSRLSSAVPKLQDVFCHWEDEFELFPPQRVPVDAEVETRNGERASGVACFFSGGVDSFYTLLKNLDEVTHLIFVHGFDITLTNWPLREKASHAAREVAKELGKSLIEVATDLRSFSDPLIHWGLYQGAALASVGLLFQHLFRKILIPSTFSYADLLPWGTHPLVDPLWSTELTDFEHDGCEAKRVDKAAYISRHEVAMKWLRVCWIDPTSDYNCGSCGKCVTTMLNLRAAGALERCETLPNTIEVSDIPKIDRLDRDGIVLAQQNKEALERRETDPELVRALEQAIRPFPVYPGRRYRFANILTDRALEIPKIGKLGRSGGHDIRFREILEPEEWNAAVKDLGGSIAQSWEWGTFHQRWGMRALRLLDEEGRGGVQLLLRHLPGAFATAYAPYGPLAADGSDLPGVMASATRRARECRAYLLYLEPRWKPDLGQEILGTRGYSQANGGLPDSTLIVDIPKDPEEHFRALPKETRSGILHAQREGVEVETVSSHSLDDSAMREFLNLLEDTSRRQGFSLASRLFYWGLMWDLPARLLLARREGTLVAGAFIATFGDEAYYFYGAFTAEEENLRALDVVQWEAMDVARKAGCSRYDMWGMPYRPYPNYWAWGFDPSKKRFGGTPVEYGGAYVRILGHLELWEQAAIRLGIKGHSALKNLYGNIFVPLGSRNIDDQ